MECCMPCRSKVKVMDDQSSQGRYWQTEDYMRDSQCLSLISNDAILQTNRRNRSQSNNVPESDGQGQCWW